MDAVGFLMGPHSIRDEEFSFVSALFFRVAGRGNTSVARGPFLDIHADCQRVMKGASLSREEALRHASMAWDAVACDPAAVGPAGGGLGISFELFEIAMLGFAEHFTAPFWDWSNADSRSRSARATSAALMWHVLGCITDVTPAGRICKPFHAVQYAHDACLEASRRAAAVTLQSVRSAARSLRCRECQASS